IERRGIAWMDGGRETEGRGEALLDAVPAAAAVVAAIHAAMVLLVKPIGRAGRHHQAVHALAMFRVALSLREKVGARPLVARLPALAAIGAVKHAGGGNGDPELPRIGGMRHDRMQDEAAAARLPARP